MSVCNIQLASDHQSIPNLDSQVVIVGRHVYLCNPYGQKRPKSNGNHPQKYPQETVLCWSSLFVWELKTLCHINNSVHKSVPIEVAAESLSLYVFSTIHLPGHSLVFAVYWLLNRR